MGGIMNAAELLTTLVTRGVEFRAHRDKLRFRPLERLSPIDLENLREHKAMILRLLRSEGIVYENRLPLDTRYFDPFDCPDPNLRGLCQPPIHTRDPDRLKRVFTACDRCQSEKYVDIPIHDGQSTRRDCAKCSRFLGFPMWYGRSEDDRAERIERLLGGQLGHVVKPASKLLFDVEQASRIANGKR